MEQNQKLVYFHGFNSEYNPESNKIKELSVLGEVYGITYDTTMPYYDVCSFLREELSRRKLTDAIYVGTSLGGFWASKMASLFGNPSIIMNPCYDPGNMLKKYVGIVHNHVSGEEKEFSSKTVESYEGRKLQDFKFDFLPLLLLDENDAILDSSTTQKVLSSLPNVFFTGGSHRFNHTNQALQHISAYISRCSFVEQMNT